MGKKIYGLFLGIYCTAVFTGCSVAGEPDMSGKTDSEQPESSKVELVVWGAEEDRELMEQIIRSFQANYRGQADFQISILKHRGKPSAKML